VTRCAKRQCGAHWNARNRTNSTASTWKEHALCFHDYQQPQQKIHEQTGLDSRGRKLPPGGNRLPDLSGYPRQAMQNL